MTLLSSRSIADARRNSRAVALLTRARIVSFREGRRLRQQVVVEHLDVARALARRYPTRFSEPSDVQQVAYVGLTKAVERFDPLTGSDLVAFAVPTITGEIKRFLRDTTWSVRPPRALQELAAVLPEEVAALTERLGRNPSLEEVASATGLPEQTVAEALRCARERRAISLDRPLDAASNVSLGDTLAIDDPRFERTDLAFSLSRARTVLTPFERHLLRLRFEDDLTQMQIAVRCGISQMQVSRLLQRILATLRAELAAENTE